MRYELMFDYLDSELNDNDLDALEAIAEFESGVN
jgi:hypothetical protein